MLLLYFFYFNTNLLYVTSLRQHFLSAYRKLICFNKVCTYCTPPPFLLGVGELGVEPPTKFSKRGGLTGPPFLEGLLGKRGVIFLSGGWNFSTKSKINLEYLMTKKVYKQEHFPLS